MSPHRDEDAETIIPLGWGGRRPPCPSPTHPDTGYRLPDPPRPPLLPCSYALLPVLAFRHGEICRLKGAQTTRADG
jgi:hypothetical protein